MPLHNVLCCFAHPDDETFMAGGILAMLSACGVRTRVVCATRGEGGEAGEPPVVSDRADLGSAREAELRCALDRLGVHSLVLLDYVDPDIGPGDALGPFDADFDTLAGQIAAQIAGMPADAVLAHGPDGEYGHPAHRLIYRATLEAVQRQGRPVSFYSTAARVPGIEDHLWNASRTAHLVLDISPWAEAKVAAMECHTSQHALFKRRHRLATVREALRRVESVYREWPPLNGAPPDDDFAALLIAAGARPAAESSLPETDG